MSKILEFITEGALLGGIRNWVWLAALAAIGAVAFVIIQIADNRDKRMIETASEAGASGAVIEGQNTTLQQTGDANEAGNEVRDDRGNARYDECLRSVAETHRGFCERYRRD